MIMKRTIIAKAFAIAAVTVFGLGVPSLANADNKGCSTATLKGNFADKDTGFLTAPPEMAGPFAGVSAQNYDGKGTLTATGTVSLNGNIVAVTERGTYTVNPDCTGTYTMQVSPIGLTTHGFFVIAASGNELQIIVTDPGTVITCISRKQFPMGDWRE